MTLFAIALILLGSTLAAIAAPNKTVLVFGDSWGALGPSYHEVQDVFNRHGVPADVRSSAIGGTTACGWAEKDGGMAMVEKARSLFPDASEGPEFVWYTLGGNDLIFSAPFASCAKTAPTFDAMVGCIRETVRTITNCTALLLDNYWKVFPKSKVMHSGYDVPCENLWCDVTITGRYDAGWCGKFRLNHTCLNELQVIFHHMYIGSLTERYRGLQAGYTGINIHGAVQKAAGVPGADVGRPVLTQGGPCKWYTLCVHPKYGTPAATAVGEAFWDLYYGKHVGPGQVDDYGILV
mmetsp:Transcript_66949/g.150473  ORF Transcript_66949/g.150473 Transcript_66949/m.150473 type:complete len:293 (+) Transcript_66949:105-983(+)